MSKLSLKDKNDIEENYLRLSMDKLKRSTPAGRVYNGVRYKFQHFIVNEEHEFGYYDPVDDSNILVAARDINERTALAKCLAYLEMVRQQS